MKQSLRNLHGIEPYEGILTFFYDESGNCRKFSLTKNGVNFEDSLWGDFVLAGVVNSFMSLAYTWGCAEPFWRESSFDLDDFKDYPYSCFKQIMIAADTETAVRCIMVCFYNLNP